MVNIRIGKAQRCRNEYSIFISFDFDMAIVNIIRSYSSRYWNKDTKEWEMPLRDLDYLQCDLKGYRLTIKDERVNTKENNKSSCIEPKSTIESILANYQFKTTPFQHQIDGLRYGLEHDKWLLGDEQGAGKTKQIIDLACIKKKENGYKHCLIICGVNGLKWNWKEEISKHSNETGYIIGERLNKRNKVIIKGNKEKVEDLRNIDKIDSYFLITNVESLRNADINNELLKLCRNNKIDMIAADEMHKMKNPNSQQGKAMLKLNAKTMVAMTGTPLMNTPLDLYIILKWLGFESHTFYAFKNHFCEYGGFGGYEIIGYKNLNELKNTLNRIMLRRLKKETLDLPEKLYVNEYVDMTPKQEQVYREVHNNILANIDQITLSPNPLTQLIRLRQATGYTGILSSVVQESAKLDRMEELVDNAVENGTKVVIFSNWTSITDIAYEKLSKKYRGCMITGETKDEDRQLYKNRFQEDDKYKFIIGSIDAMGTGLTLTAASVVILLDEPWNRAKLDQAIDRCHRIGQKSNLTIYTIMCKNTIDERIHEIVQEKGAMSDIIVDGKITGNKLETLNFLLN